MWPLFDQHRWDYQLLWSVISNNYELIQELEL